MKLYKRNQSGHLHYLAPALAVVAVAILGGVYFLAVDNAQTPNCTQLTGTFQYAAHPSVPYNEDGKGSDGRTYHCVQYVQQMINDFIAYTIVKSIPGIKAPTAAEINQVPMAKLLGNTVFDVQNGFASVSGVYNGSNKYSGTTGDVYVFQLVTNKYEHNTSFEPHGTLPTTGTTGSRTWYALCREAADSLSTSRTDKATDYTKSGQKTNMWYLRSYMRAGYTASSDAGCGSLL